MHLRLSRCWPAPPAVSAWLNNIIDEDGVIVIPETGQTIPVPDDFMCFFCINEGYNGTRELNEAMKDRCRVIHCDYWPEQQEFALLKGRMPHVADVDVRRVIRVANAIRKARREGSVDFDFSIRTLVQWTADAYERTVDLTQSFRDVVLPKLGDPLLNGPQHDALIEIANLVLSQSKE